MTYSGAWNAGNANAYSAEKCLLAVPDANTAAPILIATGKDPAMTLNCFQETYKKAALLAITDSRMGQMSDIMRLGTAKRQIREYRQFGFGRGKFI